MGKSAVLKDLDNRPAGYMRQMEDCVICRVQIGRPAQFALVFSDGSQCMHALSGPAEQHFPCKGGQIIGGYVFEGEKLLLISDEGMHEAFGRHMRMRRKEEIKKDEAAAGPQSTTLKEKEKTEHVFAQRRWPPPPCWEKARYRNGCWQEE